ncbi:DeoR family transcriptional regulator, partial [Candidatus Parcubacteria bacterium]
SKASARRPKAEAAQTPTNVPRANLTVARDESRSRRDAILTIIGHKGRVSIRDITDEISGVSSKTIQRELNALIRDGLVVREGERRWSTYRLAG